MQKRKLPRDVNARAAMIVAMSTSESISEPEKSTVVVARSGGQARAQSLSKRKRAEIAKLAAAARWKKS